MTRNDCGREASHALLHDLLHGPLVLLSFSFSLGGRPFARPTRAAFVASFLNSCSCTANAVVLVEERVRMELHTWGSWLAAVWRCSARRQIQALSRRGPV